MTSTAPDLPSNSTTRRPLGVVGQVVDQRISNLQQRLLSERYRDPAAVSALARLRRGAGKEAGTVLDVLEFTVSYRFWYGDESAAEDSAITARYENAAHLAMTLYALHQQSRSQRMHRRGQGLGSALRNLDSGPTSPPITQRFRMLGTADSFDELSHHLRGIVQLLRNGSSSLDYGRLADELVAWQDGRRERVQLSWARGFYRTARPDSSASST